MIATAALILVCSLYGDEPPPVPQAVAALQHLQPTPHQGPFSWTAGPYEYDGTGNIKAIGSEAFVYDKVGRLKSATVRSPDLASVQTQTFEYDEYGNIISTSKLGQAVSLPVEASSNRLRVVGYDGSGNVVTFGGRSYDYDAVGMVNAIRIGTSLQPRIIYAYTADDERLFAFDVMANTTHWTLRGLDNRVLRDFKQNGNVWSVDRDYIYRDGLLLASLKSAGAIEHYSLDHLGTPRVITDGTGNKIGYHVYWPFGEEWSYGNAQEGTVLQFTGHERDPDPSNGAAPLDYMHARYYQPLWGRFLSPDRSRASTTVGSPQTWNRYFYARNNPVLRFDPDGLVDQRSNEDRRITETKSVLIASAVAATSFGMKTPFEFGAAIWKRTDGSYVASDVVTEGRPDRVSLAVPPLEGLQFVRTLHTHLPRGTYPFEDRDPTRGGKPPVNRTFTATNPTEPSPGDFANARRSGVAGYVLVPSAELLVGYGSAGKHQVLLSEEDYRAWMRRAQKARVEQNERKEKEGATPPEP
ncbi:MAG TPA: RHS repeat-associated core domain-containing protein [Thermoanaerobaculia bacterium]|nr:RHS repeat-associated core domain-containing protein [Thermoanaerobaculia bacterium]